MNRKSFVKKLAFGIPGVLAIAEIIKAEKVNKIIGPDGNEWTIELHMPPFLRSDSPFCPIDSNPPSDYWCKKYLNVRAEEIKSFRFGLAKKAYLQGIKQ